ncbi:hypothetical protein NHX12_017845 [Muraenolepis orangiensis]|uniref:Uncharacterized protein n=1 Tax=Muraenolepis orangiensis TaxID=630683 RepID=A0A9Q0EVH4_9TELE|nr:hypothetical protein NHX12_017845 [Muraenolepis orangiensis]
MLGCIGIVPRTLVALLGYLVVKGRSRAATAPQRTTALQAGSFYLILLSGSRGTESTFSQMFHRVLFDTCLDLPTHCWPQDTAKKRKRDANKGAKADGMRSKPSRRPQDLVAIKNKVVFLVQNLLRLLKTFSLKDQEDSATNCTKIFIKLVYFEPVKELLTFSAQRDVSRVTNLPELAFCGLRLLLSPFHGDQKKALCDVFHQLLFVILMMGRERNTSIVLSQTVTAAQEMKEATLPFVNILLQHICFKMVEKCEFRCHGAQAVGALVSLLPNNDYASFIMWLSDYSRQSKVTPPPPPPRHFKITPPTTTTSSTQTVQGNTTQTLQGNGTHLHPDTPRHSKITAPTSTQTLQGNTSTTQTLQGNSTHLHPDTLKVTPPPPRHSKITAPTSTQTLQGNTTHHHHHHRDTPRHAKVTPPSTPPPRHSKVAHRMFAGDVVMVLLKQPERASVEGTNVFLSHHYLVHSLLFHRQADCAPMVRGHALTCLAKVLELSSLNASQALLDLFSASEENLACLMRHAADPKTSVRKSALQATLSLLKFGVIPMTTENLSILSDRCRDPALSVKKKALQCLVEMLTAQPRSDLVQRAWLSGIVPALVDAESTVQENALEALDKTLLRQVKDYSPECYFDGLQRLAWDLLGLLCYECHNLSCYFRQAFGVWFQQNKFSMSFCSNLLSHTKSDHAAGAWMLLANVASCTPNLPLKPVIQAWDHMVSVVGDVSENFNKDTRARIVDDLMSWLKSMELSLKVMSAAMETLFQLGRSENMKQTRAFLDRHCGSLELMVKHLHLLGVASLHSPAHVGEKAILLLELFSLPTKIRAHGVITLGRVCLQREDLARKYMPAFARELEVGTEVAVRNNLVVVMCDLCVRFTNVVDCYIPSISSRLQDDEQVIREQTLVMLTNLLQEEFIRWKSLLFFRFVAMLVDPIPAIASLCEYCLVHRLLKKTPLMFSQHFIECIFHFNGYSKHKAKSSIKQTDRGATCFSLQGDSNREKQCFADKELLLDDDGEQILRETFAILSLKELKLRVAAAQDSEEDQHNEAQTALHTAHKKVFSKVQKKAFIENTAPIISTLKIMLEQKHSPLIKDLMAYLQVATQDLACKVTELFPENEQLVLEMNFLQERQHPANLKLPRDDHRLHSSLALTDSPGTDGFRSQISSGDTFLESAERVVSDCERMQDVLQRWGQQREELRYILRHQLPPGSHANMLHANILCYILRHLQPPVGSSSDDDQRFSKTASENQERRLHSLRQQEQQEVQRCEQERLLQLRENAQTQEAKLKRVRAVRTQVEEKRLSNSKLVEEVEQMSGLFQQKQRELLVAVARVEELNQQLQTMRSRAEPAPPSPAHSSQLDLLYKELQMRSRLNQEQGSRLQQHRETLTRRNMEVSSMERRVTELRQRLWKKKAALHTKENTPVLDSQPPHLSVPTRVAAVGPYIPSCGPQGPPVPPRQEVLVKTSYPDSTSPDQTPLIPPPRPAKPSSGFQTTKSSSTLPCMSAHHSDTDDHLGSEYRPPVPSRTTTDPQVKMAAPPVPCKPRLLAPYSTRTFPGKTRASACHHNTLPLHHKQDKTPAAAVRPFTPDMPVATPPAFKKPQTLATSSIYSMYTSHAKTGHTKTLPRSQARVYGKPLLLAGGGQQLDSVHSGSSLSDGEEVEPPAEASSTAEGLEPSERSAPRPLSPTKLLPFLSQHSHRHPGDGDPDCPRRRLRLAPRPLKKRSSVTELEGPAVPHIQKLLYQRTTSKQEEKPEVSTEVTTLPPSKRSNLRQAGSDRLHHGMRVRFNPLALLLDSSLEGEYDLVQRVIYDVEDPSTPNDEGITALHNAVCAGHSEIVKFLVQFGFLYGVQEKMGVMNRGWVYCLWDQKAQQDDDLSVQEGEGLLVLRKEEEWWIKPRQRTLA